MFAGDGRGERSRGRNAQRRHRLADDIFAQDRPKRSPAIAAAGKWRRSGALELDVAADAIDIDDFAEQDGAAVAELRHEMTELMTGIGHGDRLSPIGDAFSGEDFGTLGGIQPVGVEPKPDREGPVQFDQPGRGHRRRRHPREKAVRERRIGVLEGEMHRHAIKIGICRD